MNDEATAAACSRCTSLERTLAELRARIAALEAKLGNNSSHSSKPPSSDPPWKSSSGKPRSGKKYGGQPDHPGTFCQRLPVQRIQHFWGLHSTPLRSLPGFAGRAKRSTAAGDFLASSRGRAESSRAQESLPLRCGRPEGDRTVTVFVNQRYKVDRVQNLLGQSTRLVALGS